MVCNLKGEANQMPATGDWVEGIPPTGPGDSVYPPVDSEQYLVEYRNPLKIPAYGIAQFKWTHNECMGWCIDNWAINPECIIRHAKINP